MSSEVDTSRRKQNSSPRDPSTPLRFAQDDKLKMGFSPVLWSIEADQDCSTIAPG
jgi:hypothetical protein